MATEVATRLAERIAEYEQQSYGPISPGYAGPDKWSEINAIARMIDEERFSPLGDNHHNAAECPHCGNPLREALDKIVFLEMEIEALKRRPVTSVGGFTAFDPHTDAYQY